MIHKEDKYMGIRNLLVLWSLTPYHPQKEEELFEIIWELDLIPPSEAVEKVLSGALCHLCALCVSY